MIAVTLGAKNGGQQQLQIGARLASNPFAIIGSIGRLTSGLTDGAMKTRKERWPTLA